MHTLKYLSTITLGSWSLFIPYKPLKTFRPKYCVINFDIPHNWGLVWIILQRSSILLCKICLLGKVLSVYLWFMALWLAVYSILTTIIMFIMSVMDFWLEMHIGCCYSNHLCSLIICTNAQPSYHTKIYTFFTSMHIHNYLSQTDRQTDRHTHTHTHTRIHNMHVYTHL